MNIPRFSAAQVNYYPDSDSGSIHTFTKIRQLMDTSSFNSRLEALPDDVVINIQHLDTHRYSKIRYELDWEPHVPYVTQKAEIKIPGAREACTIERPLQNWWFFHKLEPLKAFLESVISMVEIRTANSRNHFVSSVGLREETKSRPASSPDQPELS